MKGDMKSFTSTKIRALGTSDPGGALAGSSDANVETTAQGIGATKTYTGSNRTKGARAYYDVKKKGTASYTDFDAR